MANWLFALFLFINSAQAFEKLPAKYQIFYGNSDAKVQIVEYFSLSCPKCFEFFTEEFPSIREKYIKTGEIGWAFHPDPADLLTLQAMVCLEQLTPKQKTIFLEALIKNLLEMKRKHGCLLMQGAMEVFQRPVPELENMEFLAKTEAFQAAFQFLKQEDVIQSIPTLEINGKICEEYPTAKTVIKLIQSARLL